MIACKVDLKKEYGIAGGMLEVIATDSFSDDPAVNATVRRPAVIVVPGGGYCGVCKGREGEPVALAFLARGFQTFVLTYTVGGENGMPYPEQLVELGAAVDYVKKHADEFFVNPDEIFAVGFSAGGHLVGNLAVEWNSISQKAGIELDCKPAGVGLSYPVISKIHGHVPSFDNLLCGYSEEAQAELLKTLNLNEAVTKDTAPSFIWATAEDQIVPADSSLRYAQACSDHGVPYEIHIYPRGWHGFSICNREINSEFEDLSRMSKWLDDCAAFFRIFTKEVF